MRNVRVITEKEVLGRGEKKQAGKEYLGEDDLKSFSLSPAQRSEISRVGLVSHRWEFGQQEEARAFLGEVNLSVDSSGRDGHKWLVCNNIKSKEVRTDDIATRYPGYVCYTLQLRDTDQP